VLQNFTLRNRTTTIAVDMLGLYALMDEVIETTRLVQVVTAKPTG
jgi:hypothetical protein